MTLNEALNSLRAAFKGGSEENCEIVKVGMRELGLLLDEHTSVLTKPIPLGAVFEESGAIRDKWVFVGTRTTTSGSTEYRFVNSQNDYKYRASEAKTLIRKFPGLREYL